jgi:hypothetical protein
MNAEYLAEWIMSSADVDQYKNGNKEVLIATKCNKQLILTCERVQYPHGLHPHTKVVWIDDGYVELLYQDCLDETYNQIKHSTGNLIGEFCHHENLETIWSTLIKKRKLHDHLN